MGPVATELILALLLGFILHQLVVPNYVTFDLTYEKNKLGEVHQHLADGILTITTGWFFIHLLNLALMPVDMSLQDIFKDWAMWRTERSLPWRTFSTNSFWPL